MLLFCICSYSWVLKGQLHLFLKTLYFYVFVFLYDTESPTLHELTEYWQKMVFIFLVWIPQIRKIFINISSSIFCFITLIVNVWKIELQIVLRWRKLCTKSIKIVDQDCVVYISYDVNDAKNGPWLYESLEPIILGNGLRWNICQMWPNGMRFYS